MFDNAELGRSLREEMKLRRSLPLALLYTSMVGSLILGVAADLENGIDPTRLAERFIGVMLFIHFTGMFLHTLVRSGSAIARDRDQGTLEAIQLTAMTPREIVAGKLLAITAVWHLLNFGALLLVLPAALKAGYSVLHVAATFGMLSLAALFYGAFGLLVSTYVKRADDGHMPALFVSGIALWCLWPGMLSQAAPVLACATPAPAIDSLLDVGLSATKEGSLAWFPLFGLAIPATLLTCLFYAFGAAAFGAAAARRIHSPTSTAWSRGQALGGIALLGTVVAAFTASRLADSPIELGRTQLRDLGTYLVCLCGVMAVASMMHVRSRRQVQADAWRGPVTARDLLLGERGSAMPFLIAVLGLLTVIPALAYLPAIQSSFAIQSGFASIYILCAVVIALSLKFWVRLTEWLVLLWPGGGHVAGFVISILLAFGPLLLANVAGLSVAQYRAMFPVLASANPFVAIGEAVFGSTRVNQAESTAPLMACLVFMLAASWITCVVASRREQELERAVAKTKREMLEGGTGRA